MTDRLSLANALAEAKIDRSAAERIATEIFDAIHDNVATKPDLERLETAIHGFYAELKSDIGGLRTEFKSEIGGLRTEFKSDIAALRAELRAEISLLEHRLLIRLGGLIVVLLGLLFAALRYLPPPH